MISSVLIKRFWTRVAVIDDEDSCWLWTAGLNRGGGYGYISYDYVNYLAHILSYKIAYGEDSVPDELKVLHTCDTPRCVRPKHLYVGTQSQNVLDAVARGRWYAPSGDHSNKRRFAEKLTKERAEEINRLWLTGQYKQREIADLFGVRQGMVSRIVNGTRWGVA